MQNRSCRISPISVDRVPVSSRIEAPDERRDAPRRNKNYVARKGARQETEVAGWNGNRSASERLGPEKSRAWRKRTIERVHVDFNRGTITDRRSFAIGTRLYPGSVRIDGCPLPRSSGLVGFLQGSLGRIALPNGEECLPRKPASGTDPVCSRFVVEILYVESWGGTISFTLCVIFLFF